MFCELKYLNIKNAQAFQFKYLKLGAASEIKHCIWKIYYVSNMTPKKKLNYC